MTRFSRVEDLRVSIFMLLFRTSIVLATLRPVFRFQLRITRTTILLQWRVSHRADSASISCQISGPLGPGEKLDPLPLFSVSAGVTPSSVDSSQRPEANWRPFTSRFKPHRDSDTFYKYSVEDTSKKLKDLVCKGRVASGAQKNCWPVVTMCQSATTSIYPEAIISAERISKAHYISLVAG